MHDDRTVHATGGSRLGRGAPGAGALLLAVALTLGLGGCTDSDGGQPTSDGATASVAPGRLLERRPAPTVVLVGEVAGALPRERTRQVAAAVADVADTWMDGGFTSGDYPRPGTRRAFSRAFSGFTGSTAHQAAADRRRTTAAAISSRIEGLVAVRRVVHVDVLAVGAHARAATARVRLVYDTEGRLTGRFAVAARLAMTRVGRHWRVLAYDVTQTRVRGV
ncbi:hypothetical protein [Nocardioides sp. GY 10127]|uniref:hypothetical protein n=1 Tax=Nocardioides sp. GY 10127 TaxID=2569762 RepID=UPI0010A789BF|nr:hypothetical protein [Nocardioides sp. GY 10127]TIC84094.1 hypothetical protein E8D37_04615 [Nocardioides sp. GY 10127]